MHPMQTWRKAETLRQAHRQTEKQYIAVRRTEWFSFGGGQPPINEIRGSSLFQRGCLSSICNKFLRELTDLEQRGRWDSVLVRANPWFLKDQSKEFPSNIEAEQKHAIGKKHDHQDRPSNRSTLPRCPSPSKWGIGWQTRISGLGGQLNSDSWVFHDLEMPIITKNWKIFLRSIILAPKTSL